MLKSEWRYPKMLLSISCCLSIYVVDHYFLKSCLSIATNKALWLACGLFWETDALIFNKHLLVTYLQRRNTANTSAMPILAKTSNKKMYIRYIWYQSPVEKGRWHTTDPAQCKLLWNVFSDWVNNCNHFVACGAAGLFIRNQGETELWLSATQAIILGIYSFLFHLKGSMAFPRRDCTTSTSNTSPLPWEDRIMVSNGKKCPLLFILFYLF